MSAYTRRLPCGREFRYLESDWGCALESSYYYVVKFIAGVHLIVIFGNLVAIPCLIYYQPFYIWLPIITFLVNPMVGGSYCMMNRLENHYRSKADMPLITDRLAELFRR